MNATRLGHGPRMPFTPMAMDAKTDAAILSQLRAGKPLTAGQITVIEVLMANDRQLARDDPPAFPGRPSPPVRATRKLTPAGEGIESRRQNAGIAEARDDGEEMDAEGFHDAVQEILAKLDDKDACPNGVPDDIKRRVARLLDDMRTAAGHGGDDLVGMDADMVGRLGFATDQHWAASYGAQDPSRDARRGGEAPSAIAHLVGATRHV